MVSEVDSCAGIYVPKDLPHLVAWPADIISLSHFYTFLIILAIFWNYGCGISNGLLASPPLPSIKRLSGMVRLGWVIDVSCLRGEVRGEVCGLPWMSCAPRVVILSAN